MAQGDPSDNLSATKRQKASDGRWRFWGVEERTPNQHQRSADIAERKEANTSDARNSPSRSRSETPSRSLLKELIQDALSGHPAGLRSEHLFQWLKDNRSASIVKWDEDSLRRSINSTLSTQANKKEPDIWKYKDTQSRRPGYIWKLAEAGCGDGLDDAVQQADHEVYRDTISVGAGQTAATLSSDHGEDPHTSRVVKSASAEPSGLDQQRPDSQLVGQATTTRSSTQEGAVQPLDNGPRQAVDAGRHPQQLPSTSDKDDPTTVDSRDNGVKDDLGNLSLLDQEIYYGKIILQVQKLSRQAKELRKGIDIARTNQVDLDGLEKNAERLSNKAQELENAAREAREAAEQAAHDLQVHRDKESDIRMKEEEIDRLNQDIAEGRAKLKID